MKALLLLPYQLFEIEELHKKVERIYLVEDPLFFSDWTYKPKFHKQKLVLHRASMKAFEKRLLQQKRSVSYLDYTQLKGEGKQALFNQLQKDNVAEVYHYSWSDFVINLRYSKEAQRTNIKLIEEPSPMFLTSIADFDEVFKDKEKYRMSSFYMAQRRRLSILLDGEKKPVGGKWSYDHQNRKPLPKEDHPPIIVEKISDKEVEAAKSYVEEHFEGHYGMLTNYWFPYTHEMAVEWLDRFLQERFDLFGPYEDAITQRSPTLYHSVLTPMLNIGLLTPQQILDRTFNYIEEHPVRLNSLEGFIRQIIGWREFMHLVYLKKGVQQRNSNLFNHENRLNAAFYKGETNFAPVDHLIRQLTDLAYTHHIERLMVLGNFMLLVELHPHDVYQWFMELFIDSYDWVMVPNVYGMSQFADGGILATKPYISGSGYLNRMGDFSKKGEWNQLWTSLYWRFLFKNEELLESNARMGPVMNHLRKMEKGTLHKHVTNAENYITKLFSA